jgi:hypothetical protein
VRRLALSITGALITIASLGPGTAGAVTVGPSAFGTGLTTPCSMTCVHVNASGPAGVATAAPFDGIATRVRFEASGPFTLRVVHFTSGSAYRFVSTGPGLTGTGAGVVDTVATRVALKSGDAFGWRSGPGTTMIGSSAGAWNRFRWDSDPPAGPSPVAADDNANVGFHNINYDVEPDADGDGFGDESQDRCGGSAGSDRGCGPGVLDPQVVQVVQVSATSGLADVDPAGVTLSKSRAVLSVPVACPAGRASRCAGTVAAQTAGKVAIAARRKRRRAVLKLGSARFNVAPGKRQTVKIKLSRSARRTVRKLKKLKLRLVASESRTVGKQL